MKRCFAPGDLIRVLSPLDAYDANYSRLSMMIDVGDIFIILQMIEKARGTDDGWYTILLSNSPYSAWGYSIRMNCVIIG